VPWYIRSFAAEKLGRLRARKSVPSLIADLSADDKLDSIRVACARALGKIGDTRAIPALAEIIERRQPAPPHWLTEECLSALGAIRSASAVGVLSKVLSDASQPERNRYAAADALIRLDDEDALRALVDIVERGEMSAVDQIATHIGGSMTPWEDHPKRMATARLRDRLTSNQHSPGVNRLRAGLRGPRRAIYMRALTALGDSSIVDTLREIASTPGIGENFGAVIRCLRQLGDTGAIDIVFANLRNPLQAIASVRLLLDLEPTDSEVAKAGEILSAMRDALPNGEWGTITTYIPTTKPDFPEQVEEPFFFGDVGRSLYQSALSELHRGVNRTIRSPQGKVG
jgi:hypothetical protein